MTIEFAMKVLVVATLIILAFWALRRFQAPRSGTERLAMTVWAAFGPYDTAEFAEKGLRWAVRAVFGPKGIMEHETWIAGHAENFRRWEAEGRYSKVHEMMRKGLLHSAHGAAFETASQRYRDEAMADASQIIASLNKDLDKTGHKLESVKQQDGSYQVVHKKIWSDEEIERNEREAGETVLNAIGKNLLEDQSTEAKQLLSFLAAVYQANTGKALEASKDVGISWIACLVVQDKDPDSETVRMFRVLNSAWNSSKCAIKTERIELHLSKEAFAKTAIQKTMQNIEQVFGSAEACSEFIGARVIRKKGKEAIAEFREHIIEKVKDIVSDPTPFIAMRKALVSSMESYLRDSAFFWEEFRDRREDIYRRLNASGAQLNDGTVASCAMWADAESLFLRLLQKSMFENVSQDDWWVRYSSLYEELVRSLYRATLAQAEGKTDSMHALMVKATSETTEKFKNKLFESE